MRCYQVCTVLSKQLYIGLVLKPILVQNTFLHGDKEPARDSWACEQFQLTSEAVQVKLQKYLRIPHLQQQVPAGLNTEAAQLSWLTDLVTTDVSAWVKSILEWNGDISTGHSQLNTAAALVEAFRFSTGNAIDVWADAAQSAENVKALLGHLQLRPVQCSSVAAAIVHSIQQAASTETVDISGELFAAKLSELEQVMLEQLSCSSTTKTEDNMRFCFASLCMLSLQP